MVSYPEESPDCVFDSIFFMSNMVTYLRIITNLSQIRNFIKDILSDCLQLLCCWNVFWRGWWFSNLSTPTQGSFWFRIVSYQILFHIRNLYQIRNFIKDVLLDWLQRLCCWNDFWRGWWFTDLSTPNTLLSSIHFRYTSELAYALEEMDSVARSNSTCMLCFTYLWS